jgi:hypothetical protein
MTTLSSAPVCRGEVTAATASQAQAHVQNAITVPQAPAGARGRQNVSDHAGNRDGDGPKGNRPQHRRAASRKTGSIHSGPSCLDRRLLGDEHVTG